MAGQTTLPAIGQNVQGQVYVVKTDEFGVIEWEFNFSDDIITEYGFAVCPANDGGYLISGQTNINGEAFLYLIKINEFGSFVSIKEISLSKNYKTHPNPFSNETNLTFDKTLTEETLIEIYSITGAIIFSDLLLIGTNEYKIQRNNLDSGTYFVKMSNSKWSMSDKIIIY